MRKNCRSQQVIDERKELGIGQESLARWANCKLDRIQAYESGRRMPSCGMEREVQFALHNVRCLKDLGVPLDDAPRVEKLLDWMRGGRLPEERQLTIHEMAAAGELP